MHRRIGHWRPADVPVDLREEPRGVLPQLRLSALLRRLDEWLEDPIKVVTDDRSRTRTVWLFGCIGYHLDERRRTVVPLRLIGPRAFIQRYSVELWRPLSTLRWIPYLVRRLGLSDSGRQLHLFRDSEAIAREQRWIAAVA